MTPAVNNLKIKQWGDWLNDISAEREHNVIAYNGKDFQYISKDSVPDYQPVDLKTIIRVSLALLQSKKTTVEDRNKIAKGLIHIRESRDTRFENLGAIRKWLGGGTYQKEQLKIDTVISVLSDKLLVEKINKGEFQEGLKVDLRHAIFNSLMQDKKVNPRQLAAFGESIALGYIDKKDYSKAIKIRGEVGEIPVSPKLVKAFEAPKHTLIHEKVVNELGGVTVKQGQVHVKVREIDKQSVTSFDFKISYPARAKLERTLKEFGAHVKGSEVTVRRVKDGYYLADKDDKFSKKQFHDADSLGIEVNFPDFGKVTVGCLARDGGNTCTANWVRVELAPQIGGNSVPEVEVQIASKMLAVLGLSEVFHPQNKDDMARMELFKVLRAHIPQAEYRLTRDPMLYHLPATELRQIIEARYPYMQRIFQAGLKNLEQEMRAAGAVGLMVGVHASSKNLSSTVGSLLQEGILSAQTILEMGLPIGSSANESLKNGGGDSVSTHLVTKREIDQKVPIDKSARQAPVQLLVDLKAMETVGYGYDTRHDGAKTRALYEGRDNLIRFVNKQQIGMSHAFDNEYRVKDGISPHLIKGVVVPTEAIKASLLEGLKQTFPDGLVNGIPLKDFIHVSNTYTVEQWGADAVKAEKKTTDNIPFPYDMKELVPAEGESKALPQAMVVGGNRLKYTLESEARPVHAANTVAVYRAYELMGAKVPHVIDFEKQANGPADAPGVLLLAEHIQGDSVLDYVKGSSISNRNERRRHILQQFQEDLVVDFGDREYGPNRDGRRQKIRRELQKHFVLDCLLSHNEVLGENYRHLVVDPDGNPWRVNLKGAGAFYADGKPKTISDRVVQLDSMRDSYIYPEAANIYRSIPEDEIANQISAIEAKKEELLKLFEGPYKEKLKTRMENLFQRRDVFIEKEKALADRLKSDLVTPSNTVNYPIDPATSRIIAPPKYWEEIQAKKLGEPFLQPGPLNLSVGVLIEENDGRIWIYHPKGKAGKDRLPHGNVNVTYKRPKIEVFEGHIEDYPWDEKVSHFKEQEVLQRAAHKNVWEETGLEIELTAHVEDVLSHNGVLRLYRAKRVGGDPFGATEASFVKLATITDARKLLTTEDLNVLGKFKS